MSCIIGLGLQIPILIHMLTTLMILENLRYGKVNIWLTQLPFIGSVTARRLIEKLGDAEKIYQAGSEQLVEISDLSVRQRESIIRNHSLEKAKRIFEECQNKNIFVLCWDDDRYPARAKKPTD